MITSLKFENFRGFPKLEIQPLKGVNLIAGANNTGKTGTLEGLYLLFTSDHNQLLTLPCVFRSNVSPQDDLTTFWQALFHDRQIEVPAKIIANTSPNEILECQVRAANQNTITFSYQQSAITLNPLGRPQASAGPSQMTSITQKGHPREHVNFAIGSHTIHGGQNPFGSKLIVLTTRLEQPTRDADLFNQVTLLEGGEEKLLSLLREVDPRIQKLRYAKAPGTTQPLVYAHLGLKNALCITQTGQGFSKLFSLFCQMLVSKAQVLLIDEIENGLYYESLPQIWRGIAALAASEKIQVFATTHSRECITAAHEVFAEMKNYDFALHRLQLVKGHIEAVTHDKEMLAVAIKSGMEIR